MLESEDTAPKKQSKPPYLFLIPVGLAVVGFVGYQTVRAGFDTQVHASKFVLDTNQDKTPYSVSLPAADGSRVAVVKKAPASPTPAPSVTPSSTPSPHATASAKATKTAPHEVPAEPAVAHVQKATHTRGSAPIRLASTIGQGGSSGGAGTPDTPISQPAAETAAPATEAPAPKVTEAPAAGPIDASDRVVEARMSYAAQPDYPAIAREQGIRGTTVVLVTVDPSGNVVRTSIGESSGNSQLDNSARAAARSSRYIPPRVDGRPATETYRVVYDFSQ